jgi:YbbR domain-containing protein
MEGETKTMIKKILDSSKVKNILSKDGTVRLFALFFAIFIWVFVNDDLNPIQLLEVSIPLEIINESALWENGFMLMSNRFPKNISVVIKGRKQNIQGIRGDHLKARLDLSKIQDPREGLTIAIDVYFDPGKTREGVWIDNYSPNVVEVDIEETGENLFNVEIVTRGQLKQGYRLLGVSSVPMSVSLDGGSSFLSSVDSVKVFVDIQGGDGDFTIPSYAKVFDKWQNEIPIPENSLPVSVKIEVAKEVEVIPFVTGRPARGHVEVLRRVNPPTILIQGDKNVLAEIDDIRTEKVDIDNGRETIRKIVDFAIPSGVTVAYNIKDAQVVIDIERIEEKKINILTEKLVLINKIESYDYEFKRENIEIEITGAKSLLTLLNSDNLRVELDVGELQKGDGRVLANINLPEGVELKSEPWIQVEVMEKF